MVTNDPLTSTIEESFHKHKHMFNFSLSEVLKVLQDTQSKDRIFSPGTEALLITIYSVLIVSGLTANFLVCIVVARQGKTPRNLFVVNLALADVALCVVVMPFTLISLLQKQWTLGAFLCKAVPVVQGTSVMVTAGTITAIAVDRYVTIVRGGTRKRGSERTRVWVSIAVIWALSFSVTMPLLLHQDVEPVEFEDFLLYEACIERWPTRAGRGIYAIFVAFVQFVIPVVTLSTVHARISAYLHGAGLKNKGRARRELRRNWRTTLILASVAAAFAISWLPLTALTLVADLQPDVAHPRRLYTVLAACHVLAMTSACTNPILYGWFNTNFRREFTALLPRCRKCMRAKNGTAPLLDNCRHRTYQYDR